MKAASSKQIRDELKNKNQKELLEYCLRLARFKKENKELLTYLLFDADNESEYVQDVKEHITRSFNEMNTSGYYYMRKGTRKILSTAKKYIRYSPVVETEIDLLVHFCEEMQQLKPSYKNNKVMKNTFESQLALIEKKVNGIHEDLQLDFEPIIRKLKEEHTKIRY